MKFKVKGNIRLDDPPLTGLGDIALRVQIGESHFFPDTVAFALYDYRCRKSRDDLNRRFTFKPAGY